jgi:hypothetical protein
MIRAVAFLLALCAATSAHGQALTPEEFQSRAEGRAFGTYFMDGDLLGIEIFLKDRNVIWQAADGTCQRGIWQVQNGYVCYIYEDMFLGHCMNYRAEGEVMIGTTDEGDNFMLREGSKADVTCPTDDPLMSMDTDGGEIMLTRQVER